MKRNINEYKDEELLTVKGLKQHFRTHGRDVVKAVDGVSFQINKGEIFGLVGESGSGKTTVGRSIIGIYKPNEGSISFAGEEIAGLVAKARRRLVTQQIQMIFQDPMASLNPRKTVFESVGQGLDIHHLYKNQKEKQEKVFHILEKVGLSAEQANRYPHQFSGGQRQRIGIARALIMNPKLIIADEAISALDVSIQAQIVNLLKDIQSEMGTTFLFIAHDLAMVKYLADHIGVMHLGHLVEVGTADEIFDNPVHPYTKSLLSAIPVPDPRSEKRRTILEYEAVQSDYLDKSMRYISGEHYVLA